MKSKEICALRTRWMTTATRIVLLCYPTLVMHQLYQDWSDFLYVLYRFFVGVYRLTANWPLTMEKVTL